MTNIHVVSGDITRVNADALITAINSGGMWFGGIDGVIQRAAGSRFHAQAEAAMPLAHGQTVVALNEGAHDGAFTNVVFVVDDLQGPLQHIVYNGLVAANEAGFTSVSVPTIRMGVMLGVVENSVDEAVAEMAAGVARFTADYPQTSLSELTFVVYDDPSTQQALEAALQ